MSLCCNVKIYLELTYTTKMNLPVEVLEKIIRNNFDSFKTLISCVEILPHCKSTISSNIGIVTINNEQPYISKFPLNYNILFNDTNNVLIDTNNYDLNLLTSFLKDKLNILIAIHSNQTFNQELRSLLANIAHYINPGTSICILYANDKNYLSRLYFQEFEKLSTIINIAELYIFGDPTEQAQLFDLVTFFKFTYIFNIKEINSLVITSNTQKIYSESLTNIGTLVSRSPISNLFSIFNDCPNIHNINSFTLPSGVETITCKYMLPHAQSIHIQDFKPYRTDNIIIDGSHITENLKLSLSQFVMDPILTNFYFPNVSSLHIKPDNYPDQKISLKNCFFPNVNELNIENGIVPWEYLTSHIATLRKLSLALSSSQQISWLNESPYNINILECLSSRCINISNDILSSGNSLQKQYFELLFNFDTLAQGNHLTNIFLNKQNMAHKITMTLDNDNLQNEWHDYQHNNLNCSIYKIKLPSVNELILVTKQNDINHFNSAISDTITVPIMNENHLPPRYLYHHNLLGVQPIMDLTGIIPITNKGNEVRDRNDSIDSVSSYQSINRRRSSAESTLSSSLNDSFRTVNDDKLDLNFDFNEILPMVFTTDFHTLDNNNFSFDNVQNNMLSLLKIELHINDRINTRDQLLTNAMRSISDAFNYPLSIKFQTTKLEKIQFVLCLPNCTFSINDKIQYYMHILQQTVSMKYRDLVVTNYNDIPVDQYTVCIRP